MDGQQSLPQQQKPRVKRSHTIWLRIGVLVTGLLLIAAGVIFNIVNAVGGVIAFAAFALFMTLIQYAFPLPSDPPHFSVTIQPPDPPSVPQVSDAPRLAGYDNALYSWNQTRFTPGRGENRMDINMPEAARHKNIEVFFSYAHEDEELRNKLETHLSLLIRQGTISIWHDRNINAGSEWKREIDTHLDKSQIVLLLVSPDFIASDYCYSIEMTRAMERHESGEARVIPVILRPVDWQSAPFGRLQALPLGARPVTTWENSDQAFFDITQGIRKAVEESVARSTPTEEMLSQEQQYLNRLIAELEARKGVLEYVALTGNASVPGAHTYRNLDEEWPSEFALLLEQNYPRPKKLNWKSVEKIPLADIHEATEKYPCFVLIGEPGAGKSTTLRRLALNASYARLASSHNETIPLFLYLPRWDDEATFEEFLRQNWSFSGDPTMGLAERQIWLYLDGLNEMGASGAAKAKSLREWLHSSHPPQRVIITCRADDYVEELDLQLPIVYLQEMSEQQIRHFSIEYLHEKVEPFLEHIFAEPRNERDETRSLLRLARNPYLLAALIFVYQNAPRRELPRNNGVLFQRLAQSLWERERQKETSGWIPFEQMEVVFSRLAFAMIDEDRPVDVSLEFALNYVNDEKLLEVGQSAQLIIVDGNQVRFYHQLMQEYFAAKQLGQPGIKERVTKWTSDEGFFYSLDTDAEREAHRVLESEGFDRRWNEHPNFQKWGQVVIALCGIVPKADAIITSLLETDVFLAAHCISKGITISDKIRRNAALCLLKGLQILDALFEQIHFKTYHYDEYRPFIHALGETDDPLAAEELARYLSNHLNYIVRDDASNGLTAMTPDIALPALVKALEVPHEKQDFAYYEVISTLAGVHDSAVESILSSLLYSRNDKIRRQAIDTVRNILQPESGSHFSQKEEYSLIRSNLLQTLHGSDESEQLFATEALGELTFLEDSMVVSELLKALQNSNNDARVAAALALGKLGYPIEISTLLDGLHSSYDSIRQNALHLLGQRITRATLSAALRIALHDQNESVRAFTAYQLGSLNDLVAVPKLVKALHDPDKSVRENVVRALGELGDSVAVLELCKALHDPENSVRRSVVDVLGKLDDPSAIPELLIALHDPDDGLREQLVRTLSPSPRGWGDRPEPSKLFSALCDSNDAVPELLKALHDSNGAVRSGVAELLGDTRNPVAVPELLKALRDSEKLVRRQAAKALGQIGDPAAVPELLNTLRDIETFVAEDHSEGYYFGQSVVEALGQIGDPAAVPELLNTFYNPHSSLRRVAAEVLGKLGDSSIVPDLLNALHDPDSSLSALAARVLGKIGDPIAVPELLNTLRDPETFVVRTDTGWGGNDFGRSLVKALGKLGDPVVVPDLLKLLDHPDSSIRRDAVEALGRIGDPIAVPALLQALSNPDLFVYSKVADMLARLHTPLALSELIIALNDPEEHVRRCAAEALGKIGDPVAVPPLIQALNDPEEHVRRCAAEALGKIGDPIAVPPLIQALHDTDILVRSSAADALAKIDDPMIVPELLNILREEGTRDFYYYAINAIKGVLGTEGFLKILRDPESKAYWEVARQLAQVSPNDISLLLGALSEDSSRVRAFVAYALGELAKQSKEKAYKVYVVHHPGQNPFLGGSSEPATINRTIEECLIHLLKYHPHFPSPPAPMSETSPFLGAPPPPVDDDLVRYLAAEALGKLKSTIAIPWLTDLMGNQARVFSNSDKRVCDAAIAALKSIGTPEAHAAVEFGQIRCESRAFLIPSISIAYDEAMLLPLTSLQIHDIELKQGSVESVRVFHNPIPKKIEGDSAIVYKFRTRSGKICALRCFKQPPNPDLPFRYKQIGQYFHKFAGSITVNFKYHEAGIILENKEKKPTSQPFPIIEMEWVEGVTLLEKVKELCKTRDQEALKNLSERWIGLFSRMRKAGIAHGNLSGADMMIRADGSLVLIDYDSVYIPDFEGMLPIELGKADYQHPQMALRKFNDRMDDFSALVIYTALLALAARPELGNEYQDHDGFVSWSLDDNHLLLEQHDFKEPQQSALLHELELIEDHRLKSAVRALKQACFQSIEQVAFPFHLIDLN